MSARRRSFAARMLPLMASLVMALLMCAPATAAPTNGLTDSFISLISTSGFDAERVHGDAAKIKSCTKLKTPQPSQRQCRHTAGATCVMRRPRPDADGATVMAPDFALARPFGGFGRHLPGIVGARWQPPWRRVRAPFWAVFATAPQLRN